MPGSIPLAWCEEPIDRSTDEVQNDECYPHGQNGGEPSNYFNHGELLPMPVLLLRHGLTQTPCTDRMHVQDLVLVASPAEQPPRELQPREDEHLA